MPKFTKERFHKQILDIIRRPKPTGGKPAVMDRLLKFARGEKPKA